MADEQPLPNSPEARTTDGTIKDQALTTPETKTEIQPSTDTKTETKAESTETKTETKDGPPEKYEFKAPEGYELDEKLIEKASATFKELGLTQAQAEKLVEMYNEKAMEAAEGPYKKFEEIRTGWRNEVLSDPVMGNGTELKPEVKATLGRAIDSMGAKEAAAFREAMELTGAADNPAVIRGLLALGKAVTEGRPVTGAGPAKTGQTAPGQSKSAAQAMYPNLPSSNG